MSQNLTQPEEIDRVLMEMAGLNITTVRPIPDEAQLKGVIHGIERDKSIGVTDFLYGAVPKKLIHGLPDQ